MEQHVRNIYDRLFDFERNKQEGNSYPIHKPLNFGESEKQQGIHEINDLIAQKLDLNSPLHILDAGCGVGHSLLNLEKYPSITGLGISLSEKELSMAQYSANQKGLANRFRFEQKSYDEPLGESFDVIFCLESIKHSPNWKNTLANLLKHLRKGGQLFIAEDFYQKNHMDRLVRAFQKSWSVPDMFSEEDMLTVLQKQELQVLEQVDLDKFVIRKSKVGTWLIQYLLAGVLFFMPKSQLKTLFEIYRGVLLMDYFYAKEALSYQLLHLRKL